MKTILVTGFEAFGHMPVNPAELVARRLDGWAVDGGAVVSRVVPNTFFKCIDVVRAAIEEVRPDAVVMLGEYGGRFCFSSPVIGGGAPSYGAEGESHTRDLRFRRRNFMNLA